MTIKFNALVLVIFCFTSLSMQWRDSSSIPKSVVGKWNVLKFHSASVNSLIDKKIATIQIDPDGMTTGFIGCNRIRTTCRVDEDSIQFGTILSTRKFCEEAFMNLEDQMKKTLTNANRYRLNNNLLTLYSGKKKLVTFSKE